MSWLVLPGGGWKSPQCHWSGIFRMSLRSIPIRVLLLVSWPRPLVAGQMSVSQWARDETSWGWALLLQLINLQIRHGWGQTNSCPPEQKKEVERREEEIDTFNCFTLVYYSEDHPNPRIHLLSSEHLLESMRKNWTADVMDSNSACPTS